MAPAPEGRFRINVAWDRCAGHAQCLLAAPTVFDVDDDSLKVIVLDPDPVEALREAVDRAVSMCPTGALEVLG